MATKKKQRGLTGRHLAIACLFVAWMGVIIWRLAFLQIMRHAELAEKAARQRERLENVTAARGTIVDRHGTLLALSGDTVTIKADLHQIVDKDLPFVVKTLAETLKLNEGDLNARFHGELKDFVIAKKVAPEAVDALRNVTESADLKIARKFTGIKILHEPQRLYPQSNLAAHILGFVSKPEVIAKGKAAPDATPSPSLIGAAGLEATQEKQLAGQSGKSFLETDSQGHVLSRADQEALAGSTIITTIDATLQYKAEKMLAQAVEETQSESGSAIVLDISNGEVLTLANYPTYDPMHLTGSDKEAYARRNRALTDPYEPGSVFKIVTYSAAIQEGIVKPENKIFCGNGQIAIGPRIVRDAHPYGELTVREALAKSSNVAAIKIGMQVGKERMFDYLTRFGFGKKTGIDLPYESPGIVRKFENWTQNSMGSIPMGHEIGVTAVQAVSAMAAIANRGTWVQPHIVKQIVSGDAEQRELWKANPATRQVVNEQTADTMKTMLADVVEIGTARHAVQLAGYTAAGKTGTAQKVINGAYSSSAYVASFAGFVPATSPRFAIIVVLDYPKGAHQGGQVAAPVFNQIAQAALVDYGVLPDTEDHKEKMAALEKEFQARDKGLAKSLVAAAPAPNRPAVTPPPQASVKPTATPTATPAIAKATAAPKATPILKLPTPKASSTPAVAVKKAPEATKPQATKQAVANAPNVVGRNLREAVALCSQARVKLKAIGIGLAKSQRQVGDTLIVEFK
ncbi:MAG: penicillin-binding protein 2 [Blastocatellia bacterium]